MTTVRAFLLLLLSSAVVLLVGYCSVLGSEEGAEDCEGSGIVPSLSLYYIAGAGPVEMVCSGPSVCDGASCKETTYNLVPATTSHQCVCVDAEGGVSLPGSFSCSLRVLATVTFFLTTWDHECMEVTCSPECQTAAAESEEDDLFWCCCP